MLTFQAHEGAVCSVVFAPDGRHLATACENEPVRLWNLDSSTVAKEFTANDLAPTLAFAPDGRFLAVGGDRFTVFEVTTGRRVATGRFVRGVAFAPDGKEVAACSPLTRRALPSGKSLPGGWGEYRSRYAGHNSAHASGALAYSPDGTTLATVFTVWTRGRERHLIRLWDRKTGEQRGDLVADFTNADPPYITYSPGGEAVAGVYASRVGVLDATTGETVAVLKAGTKHFKGIAFTPDGKRLIAVSNDAAARVYDTATWTATTGYEWAVGRLTAVAVAPDGLRAACGSDRGRVVVWDLD